MTFEVAYFWYVKLGPLWYSLILLGFAGIGIGLMWLYSSRED